MVNKKLIIEMLNYDVERYQHYNSLYEKSEDCLQRGLLWENMNRYTSMLNAREQMCVAFGYKLVYDENGKVTDIVEK